MIVRCQVIGLCLWVMPSLFALDLVKDDRPAGEFIISSEAHKAIRFSVTDVAYWINEMTGCSVPALTESSTAKNTKVFIGKEFAGQWRNGFNGLCFEAHDYSSFSLSPRLPIRYHRTVVEQQ